MIYLLYSRGLMVTKSIAAILFVFRPGREGDRARLDSCTGWVQHVVRLRGGRTYEFALERQLSKGSAEVFLLDQDERQLLELGGQSCGGRLTLEGDGRYYLRWEFKKATGRCELRWKEI